MFLSRILLLFAISISMPAAALAVNQGSADQKDPLQRETPRSSIRQFLESCHSGNFLRASEYLDLSRIPKNQRPTQGAEYARELGRFLDQDAEFELEQLDNTPNGRGGEGLSADLDRIATYRREGHSASLYLQRQDADGVSVWVVSADSVARIPQSLSTYREPALQKIMPKPLVEIKLLGTPVWSWLVMVVLGLLLALVSKWLSKLVVGIAKPIAKHYAPWLAGFRLATLTDPIRLLLSVAVFRACVEAFALSALVHQFVSNILALLAVIGAASTLMRLTDAASDQIIARLEARQRSLSYSVFPLGVRFIKVCIFVAGVLFVLQKWWDLQFTTILAGVGVGGLAVALAAQKTLENLFGGISILTDRPVLVGDVCQFGGQTGTVADIGLRSTRVRTAERTVVTIPNATFSTMTLENLSQRDRMLFKPVLQLRRDTSPGQIRELMQAVEALLRTQPNVDPTDVPVRFVSIAPESFRLEIFSYILTTDGNEFLRAQTELLLRILEMTEELGVKLAVPFQESWPRTGQTPAS